MRKVRLEMDSLLAVAAFLLLALQVSTCLPAELGAASNQQHWKRALGEGRQWWLEQEASELEGPAPTRQPLRAAGQELSAKKKLTRFKNMYEDRKERRRPFSVASNIDLSTDLHRVDGKLSADVGLTLPHAVVAKLAKDAFEQLLEGAKQMISTFASSSSSLKDAEYLASSHSSTSSDSTSLAGVYRSIFEIIGMLTKLAANTTLLMDHRFAQFVKFLEELLERITNYPMSY